MKNKIEDLNNFLIKIPSYDYFTKIFVYFNTGKEEETMTKYETQLKITNLTIKINKHFVNNKEKCVLKNFR